MKKLFIVLLVLALAFSVVGCGGTDVPEEPAEEPGEEPSEEPEEEPDQEAADTIRVGIDVDGGIIDPRLATDTTSYRVIELVFDGLVYLDETLAPEPALATSWESSEDGLEWTFNLREGVTFHDGSEFTSEDVVHTYETEIDPDFGARYRSLYDPITEIETIDDYTVKFTLSEPYAPLFAYLDLGIVPSEADEIEDFSSNPIGTGPYKFDSWSKNNNISLVANEDYWDGEPKTENLVIYIIPDNTTRVDALEAGDVDLVHSPLSPMDIDRIKANDEFIVYETNALGYTYVGFNHTKGVLQEKEVRVGISHMIDKETIANDIYLGMDQPATSPILPVSWAYSDSITNYPFDPEKGVEILNEAGWTDSDGDGILDKDGQKLSVELSTHSEDPNRIQALEYIQNVLMENGIDATLTTVEWPTFFSKVQNLEHEISLVGWLNLVGPDRSMYNQFHSEGTSNYGGYDNPDLDQLLEDARKETDQERRAELYQQAAQIVNDEVMYNVILYQGYIAMFDKDLEGFEPHPKGAFKSLKDAVLYE